jgi:hypothetical protein
MASKAIMDMMPKKKGSVSENWTRVTSTISKYICFNTAYQLIVKKLENKIVYHKEQLSVDT